MLRTQTKWMGMALVAAALCMAVSVGAAEKRPLPPFALTTIDGVTTDSVTSLGTGTHLLVYVVPGGAPSERLLAAFKAWDSEALRARVVVVLGGTKDDADRWLAAAGAELQPLRYAIDPRSEIRQALKLTGAPHMIGIADGRIEWGLSGVLNDPRMMESVVRTWIARP